MYARLSVSGASDCWALTDRTRAVIAEQLRGGLPGCGAE
jgi:hypothetical protein